MDRPQVEDGTAAAEDHGQMNRDPEDEKPEYLSGVRQWLVLASVTLVAFVMLLDMSIIGTVNLNLLFSRFGLLFTTCSLQFR